MATTLALRAEGAVLVVSCYELGRQPVSAATALAALLREGFLPAALDVAVDAIDDAALRAARFIAISVPMHTALRLGVRVAARARALNPAAHLCLFGLYAALNRAHLLARHCDSVIGGEPDESLCALANSLAAALDAGERDLREVTSAPPPGVATRLHPDPAPPVKPARRPALPARSGLPLLDRYARLAGGPHGEVLVAAVEASRGCLHLCRHCPIVPVYGGRFVAVPRETVLADIAQQVTAGARHVTFGDPDFLNGPTHALKLAQELHARFPEVTFDATIKIEHLLKHRDLVPQLAQSGCLFITSAVESLNEDVLRALDKGHVAADVPVALGLVRGAGIDLRPTLLPYTPWARLSDIAALFDFAEEHGLVDQIDPVQYTLRLLIPPGSAVLDLPGDKPWLRALDEAWFGWRWAHEDPRVDALQAESGALAQAHAEAGRDPRETFAALRALARRAAGSHSQSESPGLGSSESSVRGESESRAQAAPGPLPGPRKPVPRLTEPWFC